MSSPTTPEPRAADVEELREVFGRFFMSLDCPQYSDQAGALRARTERLLPALFRAVEERDGFKRGFEIERAAHARTREALRDAKGLLFSPKSLRALSDFVLRHGDLDSNAVCLTSLDLRKRAEATEQFRAAQALLEGEGDGQ